ncbi:MAG: hypothetical protein V8Q83_10345 [Blautia sp.]
MLIPLPQPISPSGTSYISSKSWDDNDAGNFQKDNPKNLQPQFQKIYLRINKELDFLFRERDNASEERFRKLDETIRAVQNARKETAATELEEIHQKRRRHRKGKRS